jgi:hypothetical protein
VLALALALMGLRSVVGLTGGVSYATLVARETPGVAIRGKGGTIIRGERRNASGVRSFLGVAGMRSTGRMCNT